jgi:hypothetical protein
MLNNNPNQNLFIPRPPDVVTILWSKNPLQPRSPRTIVDANVFGNAAPCNRFLQPGKRYLHAKDCLLENGFKRVFEERLGSVFGLSVFVRQY